MTTPKRGDRIRLLAMPNDPDPIPVGSEGTVTFATTGDFAQVGVDWDCGRTLMLIPGEDHFEIIQSGKEG